MREKAGDYYGTYGSAFLRKRHKRVLNLWVGKKMLRKNGNELS